MSRSRILVRGGHVVTVDDDLGVIPDGEVLIEDGVIVAVGANLGVNDAEVIHADGGIIAPGTVDTHRHTWQAQLRGVATKIALQEYINGFWVDSVPSYSAEDVELGTYVGALEALDAGVTSIFDYSHVNNSPEHAEAGLEGLSKSGIRGVFGYSFGQAEIFAPPYFDRLADFARLAEERFKSPGLITLGAALSEIGLAPVSFNAAQKRIADEYGAISSSHIATGQAFPTGLKELADAGVLDEKLILVHATTLSDEDWGIAGDAGVKISTTPESELNMGMGRIAIAKTIAHGLKPTIGADVVSLGSGDIFTQLRIALSFARWNDAEPTLLQGRDIYGMEIQPEDALRWGTINGAEALGLGRRAGSLTPGKQADVIVVSGKNIGSRPVNDPVGQLVMQTHPGSIDTVIVGGRIVKRDGRLVGVDLPSLLRQLEESSVRVQERITDRVAAKQPLTEEQIAQFPGWITHNLAS
jgi:cytosine/adenosine deaminase-related metal-dependent hydrolase